MWFIFEGVYWGMKLRIIYIGGYIYSWCVLVILKIISKKKILYILILDN